MKCRPTLLELSRVEMDVVKAERSRDASVSIPTEIARMLFDDVLWGELPAAIKALNEQAADYQQTLGLIRQRIANLDSERAHAERELANLVSGIGKKIEAFSKRRKDKSAA